MSKISECEDCKARLVGYSLAIRTCDACEAKRWIKAGAQRTAEDIRASRIYSKSYSVASELDADQFDADWEQSRR